MEKYFILSPWNDVYLEVDKAYYEKLRCFLIYKEIYFTDDWYLLIHKETGCIVAYRIMLHIIERGKDI